LFFASLYPEKSKGNHLKQKFIDFDAKILKTPLKHKHFQITSLVICTFFIDNLQSSLFLLIFAKKCRTINNTQYE